MQAGRWQLHHAGKQDSSIAVQHDTVPARSLFLPMVHSEPASNTQKEQAQAQVQTHISSLDWAEDHVVRQPSRPGCFFHR